jgi:hypothetical protein
MRSPVAEVLAAFAAAADRLGVQWYLFGAQAALLYGAARLTADADVTVDLGARPTQELVDALAARGFDLRMPDADDFIERTRVVPLVHRSTGMPIDVVLAAPGIEELFLARARLRTVGDVTVPVASAEDVLVMKILAGRAKDRDDAAAILAANDGLDLAVVRDTLRLLEQALDQSDLLPELEKLLARRPSR